MRILPPLAASFLCLLCLRPAACAEEYLGADAILKQVDAQSAGDPQKPGPLPTWRADLQRFQERLPALPPAEAARDWLALFDRAMKLPSLPSEPSYNGNVPPRLLETFQVLPPPADWDALADGIAARPLPDKGKPDLATLVLRVFAGMLQGKPDTVSHAIDALRQQAESLENSDQEQVLNNVQELQDALFVMRGDKRGMLASFEAKLAQLSPGGGSNPADAQMLRANDLQIPDLLTLAGPTRAETLLKHLFTLEMQGIQINDEKTKALARKVALAAGERLKFAPWNLADSLDSVALYELLNKKFGGVADSRGNRQTADAYYLLALITKGRYDEAAALAIRLGKNVTRGQEDAFVGLPEAALNDLAAKGYAKEVFQFFGRLLATHPELPYWRSYTTAGVLAGETDAMLASVKAAGERTDLKPAARNNLRKAYGDALLAADHVAEAVPILRESAAAARRAAGDGTASGNNNDLVQASDQSVSLACIGQLLGDDALVNEQLDIVVAGAKTQPGIVESLGGCGSNLGETFLAAKRGPEMERLLLASLLKGQQDLVAQRAQRNGIPGLVEGDNYSLTQRPLKALIDLYYRADRFEDIVALLDHARDWGAEDVAAFFGSRQESAGEEFGYQAARALQKTGHADAALRLVNADLERFGGSDPAYVLLLELLPPAQAEARLDALFQGDQFEERPLIWRAVLQLSQGRLDEAEKSARQAISIDPSDGEEGRGDRMRAYAVLADILERKGDKEKAGQMRQAVQAIRLSEDADRFHSAGLLTRAVGMYEKALGYFADAYCIQSRLAIQLNALGKTDEAMAHYERAYELMPDSFGRMESHCFGCERAFAGERAQGTAERVFRRLVEKQPDNPRVHYLLGYLRMEQERKAEAAHEFGEAVRLDPDYINAWKQLAATTDVPSDRDRAELNLLRLDPRHKHDSVDLTNVSDLRALWQAGEAAAKFTLPEPANIYPLAASKLVLEQERQRRPAAPAQGGATVFAPHLAQEGDEPLAPWSMILKNQVVSQALQLLPRGSETILGE